MLPNVEGLSTNFAIRVGGQKMSTRMEMTMNECVSGKEIPGLPRRFEPLHLPLASSRRPM
jgi:hypothetical protein